MFGLPGKLRTMRTENRPLTSRFAQCLLSLTMGVTIIATGTGSGSPVEASGVLSKFEPLDAPCRLVDTRSDGHGVIEGGRTIDVPLVGHCGIPADATAMSMTLTAVHTQTQSYFTIFPSGTSRPESSANNYMVGTTRANGAVVKVGANGNLSLSSHGTAHAVIDISGYWVPSDATSSGRFVPAAPARLLDTRASGRPAAGSETRVPLPAGVPADATALAVNITTTATSTTSGFFTAHPAGTALPNASSLNFDAMNQTRAAAQIVPVNNNGLDIYTNTGEHIIVDYNGYFTGGSAAVSTDGLFVPVQPFRVHDSRSGAAHSAGSIRTVDPTSAWGGGAQAAVIANVTSVDPIQAGYSTTYPAGTAVSDTSTVNAAPGEAAPNFAVIPTSAHGISVFSHNQTNIVIDITGYFTGAPMPSGAPVTQPGTTPTPDAPAASALPGCPSTGRAAVVDKAAQRFWLCTDGQSVTDRLKMTTASARYGLPSIGTHTVFSKDVISVGIDGSTLHRFVSFYRTPQNSRIGFHQYVHQDPNTIGDLNQRGASAGCLRVSTDDSWTVWDHLRIGDKVVVITN